MDPNIKPWYEGQQGVNREVIGRQQAQTGLIELQRLKEQQAAEAEVMRAIQTNPALAQQLLGGGGSVLASLGPADAMGGPPGGGQAPGAITQSPLGGGPGQQIPAYPDASRYAGAGAAGGGQVPPDVMGQAGTPTLATLGPQGAVPGVPQPQGQQNPVLAMAARDPRAAMMLQQQMQQAQDRQMTMQAQRLKMGLAMMGSLGQMAQGVTDQAGWDQLRQDAAQINPQLAARLPQVYSKEVRDRVVAQALEVKDRLTLDIAAMKEQTDLRAQRFKEQQAAGSIPEYVKGEGPLNAAIDTLMQRANLPRGTVPTPDIIEQARKDVQQGKVDVSAAQGVGQAQQRSLGETAQKRLEAYDKTGMAGQDMHTVLDEAERLMREGVYGNSLTDQATMAAYKRGLFQDDAQAQRTARLQELGSQLVLAHGSLGSGVSTKDAEIYAKAAGNFQQAKNLDEMKQSIQSMRTIGNTAIRNANAARESYEKTGKLPAFQERGTFTDADIAATMADPRNKGKTRQQIIDGLLAAGLTYQQ